MTHSYCMTIVAFNHSDQTEQGASAVAKVLMLGIQFRVAALRIKSLLM